MYTDSNATLFSHEIYIEIKRWCLVCTKPLTNVWQRYTRMLEPFIHVFNDSLVIFRKKYSRSSRCSICLIFFKADYKYL